MAYVYCDYCDEGLDKPTIRQILTRDYKCPNCGDDCFELLYKDDVNDAMSQLLDRLEALERGQNNV